MLNRKAQTKEGRKLTAAWLNIMAAGIVSGGSVPLLTTLALDGWGARARALLLLPCVALPLSLALHLVGRVIVRENTCIGQGMQPGFRRARDQRGRFPTESDVDAVLAEFGNDPREAIRALLCDLEAFAADDDAMPSRTPSAERVRL